VSEMRLPLCPICKREVLLPMSTWIFKYEKEKVYGNWICTNCGFYITTGKNTGTEPEDITADFHIPLRSRIEYLRKEYMKE
jgi:C4-type Zn-finger protein